MELDFIYELQQHLPLAVLKLHIYNICFSIVSELQQHLPLAVLKL